jgi:hypothetical protein
MRRLRKTKERAREIRRLKASLAAFVGPGDAPSEAKANELAIKRGPPATGKGLLIGVRIRPSALKALDGWITRQGDEPSRPEAIRRLVDQALVGKRPPRAQSKESARKATQMAAREIDQLGDQSATSEERASRKRRLLSGPKEFRDLRGDRPKTKI